MSISVSDKILELLSKRPMFGFEIADNGIKIGTVYTTLHRMEAKGLITRSSVEPSSHRYAHNRIIYSITCVTKITHPFETVAIGPYETRNLDRTIARWLVPRLRKYRDVMVDRSWDCTSGPAHTNMIIGSMIDAFTIIRELDFIDDPVMKLTVEKGMKDFHDYYFCLWT